jgi:hypothetical protein
LAAYGDDDDSTTEVASVKAVVVDCYTCGPIDTLDGISADLSDISSVLPLRKDCALRSVR